MKITVNPIRCSLLFAVLFSFKCFSQETITVDILSAVSNSKNYLFVGVTYKNHTPTFTPDFNMIADVLSRMQARYDYNHEILTTEYRKLLNLQLVNSWNQSFLVEQRKKVTAWLEKNYTQIDISEPANFENVLTIITVLFKMDSIAEELKLLNKINKEIERLKLADPDNFYKSARFEDMKKALNKLKSYDRMKVGEIAVEYGLF